MATINVSIPDKLKQKAEALVKAGYYASFSDVVRDSLREIVDKNIYDLLGDRAEKDYIEGRTVSLKTDKDIKEYVDKIASNARARNHK